MKFIGRKEELQKLCRAIHSDELVFGLHNVYTISIDKMHL